MINPTEQAPVTATISPKTQIDTIRAHLMTGATITTWDAYRLYQITCLAQRIHELRKSGLLIQSEMVKHNEKWFSVYWLSESTLLDADFSSNLSSEVTANAPA